MIRPFGPEPCTRVRSSPCSLASRRASGEERTGPASAGRGGAAEGADAPARGAAGIDATSSRVVAADGCWRPPVITAASFCDGPVLRCGSAAGAGTSGFSGSGRGAAPPPDGTAAPATSASMFSSGAAITPTRVPTGTLSFSLIRRRRSTPSPRATSSMIALSVSTSPMGSPLLTASPSFLSHLTSFPSSIVGESASMKTLVAMVVARVSRDT
jgi:hypothetical protein